MLKWYSNKQVAIFFDEVPQVGIRYIVPSMSDETKKSIKKYPFINRKPLKVMLKDLKKKRIYNFEIPKGYCYDGATIPRLFWRIIGPNTDNKFLIAALIHDVLCENHQYILHDRSFSTKVFDALLEASDVCPLKRFIMKYSVDFFQRFCNWDRRGNG